MPSVIILQRVVPHYRIPVFRRLYDLFGWQVVSDAAARDGLAQTDVAREPFSIPYEFTFQGAKNPYRANVPLTRILRETGAQAVIAEFSLSMTSTYELVARRALRGAPKTVFWSHGYNMDRGIHDWRQWPFQAPRILLSKLADAHLCYSDEGRDFLAGYMPRERLFVAPNTIDVTEMRARGSRLGRRQPPGRPHLLTIGRILPEKKFPMLVRVFHRFREVFPEAVLTIIGDGPDAKRTRQAAGDELGRSIRMPGREYGEEQLARHFCSADLVVFPGAVGLSVNHALAYGVPVMAFDRSPDGPGHHPEIAYVENGVTGCRVSEYSDAGLLDALQGFFTEHENPTADFAESIRDYVERHIMLDRMIEGFAEVNRFLETQGIDGKRGFGDDARSTGNERTVRARQV